MARGILCPYCRTRPLSKHVNAKTCGERACQMEKNRLRCLKLHHEKSKDPQYRKVRANKNKERLLDPAVREISKQYMRERYAEIKADPVKYAAALKYRREYMRDRPDQRKKKVIIHLTHRDRVHS